jgi:hypothetical protein
MLNDNYITTEHHNAIQAKAIPKTKDIFLCEKKISYRLTIIPNFPSFSGVVNSLIARYIIASKLKFATR